MKLEGIIFDKEKNRIIIDMEGITTIEIPPQDLRDLLPVKTEAEKIDDLKMILHDIHRERLTKLNYYITRMAELAKSMDAGRKELKKCGKMVCVKKWQAVIKSYIDEKNALAEIRRAVGLLWKDEKKLMARIARLEVGIEEAHNE